MATPARRGDWLRTFRGLTMITYPQFIRSFLETVERSGATWPLTTKEGRVDARMQRAPRRQPEINP
jgi:hypothetical protein